MVSRARPTVPCPKPLLLFRTNGVHRGFSHHFLDPSLSPLPPLASAYEGGKSAAKKMLNECLITNFIFTMGLTLPLAFDSVKERICTELKSLFNSQMNMPNGQDYRFPGRLTIQEVAAHLHNDVEDLDLLQTIYLDLVNQNLQSAYFAQALEYVLAFGGAF